MFIYKPGREWENYAGDGKRSQIERRHLSSISKAALRAGPPGWAFRGFCWALSIRLAGEGGRFVLRTPSAEFQEFLRGSAYLPATRPGCFQSAEEPLQENHVFFAIKAYHVFQWILHHHLRARGGGDGIECSK